MDGTYTGNAYTDNTWEQSVVPYTPIVNTGSATAVELVDTEPGQIMLVGGDQVELIA